jgi:hypothetical protein
MDYLFSKLTNKINLLEQMAPGKFFPADGWDFFKQDIDEWAVCYLNNNKINRLLYINSFLLPKNFSPKKCNEQLFEADYSPPQGWGVWSGASNSLPRLEQPLYLRTAPLNEGEPLFFIRFFQGYPKESESYLEINQKIPTALNLHWVEEKKAYCILNQQGDLVPQILIDKIDDRNYLLMRKNVLDKFLSITNSVLMRCFEYRKIDDDLDYEDVKIRTESFVSNAKFCHRNNYFDTKDSTKGVEIRGYNIVEQDKDYNQIEHEEYQAAKGKHPLEFIIQDIKHGNKTVTIDLLEDNLSSYFVKSDKPWQTSPVFFTPDVLQKYKNNPDKYTLIERTINCRGGWHLQTFDINDQGQVHTMAIYLTYLPYEELCYWRCFNEAPKGNISKRSFDTDFLAKFSEEPEHINELKTTLTQLSKINIQPENEPLWLPHLNDIDKTFFGFYYVLSDNYIEWQNYIQDLARIVIEGISKKTISKISERLGCSDAKLASIKLLEKCLQARIEPSLVKEIIDPLSALQNARTTKTKAHRGSQPDPSKLKSDAMDRLKAIIKALLSLKTLCEQGRLNN